MNLAAILGVCLLGLGYLTPGAPQGAGQPPAATSSESPTQQSQGAPAAQPQTQPAQTSEPAQPVSPPTGQTPNSPGQAKPAPNRPRHHKKTTPNCSNAPAALNTAVAKPADPAVDKPADPTDSASAGSADGASTKPDSNSAGATVPGSKALPPCPPPKKVVQNGGSEEPAIQLVGGTTAEQAVQQRSTDQLTTATRENLKKIDGRQLNPGQQEMVNQIKQFMEQSKTAVAAGDLERGHDLAQKAHLLSDELVKP
jgi:hypothetical protein